MTLSIEPDLYLSMCPCLYPCISLQTQISTFPGKKGVGVFIYIRIRIDRGVYMHIFCHLYADLYRYMQIYMQIHIKIYPYRYTRIYKYI